MTAAAGLHVKYLYRASIATLMIGVGISVTLYQTAEDVGDNAMVMEFRNSKAFRHELEVYGGKMSLLGDQFSCWFSGLWQGKQLGVTAGCISVALALALFAIARLNHEAASPRGAGKDLS
jgi:hypothetical protein